MTISSLRISTLMALAICLPLLANIETPIGTLGNTAHVTEASSQKDRKRAADFAELIAASKEKKQVRVIVGLDVPFTPEGRLPRIRVARQRNDIEMAQTDVLQKLSSVYSRDIKRFKTIPFFAIEVDQAGLEALESDLMVSSIKPDRIHKPSLTQSTALIGAPQAWTAGYTGSNWAVAIIDSGVDSSHPFFGGRVVSEACYSSSGPDYFSLCPGGVTQSTATGSGDDCDVSIDGCGHGTHVAGIAAGSGSSFSGVAKNAPIIAIKVFHRINDTFECGGVPSCIGAFTSDIDLGLERVLTLSSSMSIAAVNMSLGGGSYSTTCDDDEPSTTALINSLRFANVATIVASGNEETFNAISSPACISSAISVGATRDTSDSIPSYSNSVSFLSLLAPGSGIESSIPDGLFDIYDGTSMAAPHVAGAWSILRQHSPTATVNQILSAISATGKPVLDSRNGIIKPRLQVNDAIQAMGCTYTLSSPSQSVSGSGGAINVGLTASNQDCLWKTGSNVNWITVTSGESVTGSNTVTMNVAPNAGGQRSGTVLIAGTAHLVTQAACSYSFANGSQNFPSSGGTGTINMTASGPGCSWNATVAPPIAFNAVSSTLGAIPDATGEGPRTPGDPLNVQFVVSGLNSSQVGNISVAFTGTHSWLGDVEVTLIAPNGTQHRVFGYTMATSSGSYGAGKTLNGTYVFSDTATANWWTSVGGQTDPVPSGTYRTSNSGGPGATSPMPDTSIMATFASLTDMNGTWTLRFTDGANQDSGSVSAASIGFSSPTPWLTITGNASGTGDGSIQYAVASNSSQSSRTGYIGVGDQLFTITQAGTAAPPSGSIAGTVRYYFGSSPLAVPNVTLSAAGAQNVSGSSGSNGTFSLTGFGSGAYTLTPSKTGQVGGISSLDASRIAQYSAALITLTPDQLIAADVTNNGSVSSLDASRIAQWVVGITSSGTNITGTWRFTPASRSYSSVTESLTGQDFTAILMGDVTGNWAPPAPIAEGQWGSRTVGQEIGSQKSVAGGRSDVAKAIGFGIYSDIARTRGVRNTFSGAFGDKASMNRTASPRSVGEVLEIPISVAEAMDILAYDAVIVYDSDVLEPVLERPVRSLGTLSTNFNVVVNRSERGKIRLGAYGVVPVTGDGELIVLRFRVKRPFARLADAKLRFESLTINEKSVISGAVRP